MIRRALIRATFALENLNASSPRLTVSNIRLFSDLTVTVKDQPVISVYLRHCMILKNMEKIVNSPSVPTRCLMRFCRNSANFYIAQNRKDYLEELHKEPNFHRLCNIICHRQRMTDEEAVNFLISLCMFNTYQSNPSIVTLFWRQHIDEKVNRLPAEQIRTLLEDGLNYLRNTLVLKSEKLSLKRRLSLHHGCETKDDKLLNMNTYFLPITLQSKEFRQEIFEGIMNKPIDELLMILSAIEERVNNRNLEFYDVEIVDTIVDSAMWDNCDSEKGFTILRSLMKIGHKHIPLLHYLIEQIDYQETQDIELLSVSFSYATHFNCERAIKILLQKFIDQRNLIKYSKRIMINVTFNMAMVNYFDYDLLDSLFRYEMTYKFGSAYSFNQLRRLIRILNNYHPRSDIPNIFPMMVPTMIPTMSPEMVRKRVEKKERKKEIELKQFKSTLELMFGGPMYVLSQVLLPNNFHAHHVVIFRQGGYPVAVNLDYERTRLSKISIPQNGHMVIFQYIPIVGTVLNTGEVKGPFKCYLNCLKSKYNVIDVRHIEWQKIPENKRIPWIMQKIKTSCKHIYEL